MIIDLIEISAGDIINNEYRPGKGKARAFIGEHNNVLGYIWFTITNNEMNIEMLEVIEKEQGIGTEAVNYLFNTFDIQLITGQVLKEPSMRAYCFWESLGAHMEGEPGEDVYFELYKEE